MKKILFWQVIMTMVVLGSFFIALHFTENNNLISSIIALGAITLATIISFAVLTIMVISLGGSAVISKAIAKAHVGTIVLAIGASAIAATIISAITMVEATTNIAAIPGAIVVCLLVVIVALAIRDTKPNISNGNLLTIYPLQFLITLLPMLYAIRK